MFVFGEISTSRPHFIIEMNRSGLYKRTDVYSLIDEERDYQDSFRIDGISLVGRHEIGEHILLIEEYTARARAAWVAGVGSEEALNGVRKIAALAVRCMEEHKTPSRIPTRHQRCN